jgi:hypothetical protein
MCTSIVEIAPAEGMAKSADEWFALTDAVVAYDHARHALAGDVITLDFINTDLPPGARAAVELTLESAKALHDALARAIAAADIEEAERLAGIEQARRNAQASAPATRVAA